MASSLPPVRSPGNDRKRSRGPIGVIATVAALITAFAWFVLFETPVERQSAAKTPLAPAATNAVGSPRADSKSGEANSGARANAEIHQQVAEALGQAETQFKAMEFARSELIGRIDGEQVKGVYYLIAQPTSEEYAKYVSILSASMRSLSKEAQRLAHDRQVKLLQEYTGFSSPFKIVERWRRDVVNPDGTPGLRETSSETFVASPDSYELTRDGIRIRGRGGDGSGAMRSFVGEAKSRYRHIFEQE
jgi:hypothetical protein